MKKSLVLILTFLLPVLIAILFKFFSVSHFDLRILYQQEVPYLPGCGEITAPYSVNVNTSFINSEGRSVLPFIPKTLKIVSFMGEESLITEMNMIADAFYDKENVTIFMITDTLYAQDWKVPLSESVTLIKSNSEVNNRLKQCVFLFEEGSGDNALLLDEFNRIRGYYSLYTMQEVDSLIIETKILLREKDLTE